MKPLIWNLEFRLFGKSYNSKTQKTIPEKVMQTIPCQHRAVGNSERSFLCGSVTEQARKDVFDYFWSLSSWEAKKSYITGLVAVRNVNKRRKVSESSEETTIPRRQKGMDCYLPKDDGIKVRVCKEFF